MAAPFDSTLRALEGRGLSGSALVLGTVTALGVACAVWLGRGSMSVYAVSDRARVEVDRMAHPVVPQIGGLVVENRLTLGRKVRAGDDLLVLDSTTERLQVAQERSRLRANESSLAAVERELAAERDGTTRQGHSAVAARKLARARAESAASTAAAARQQDEIVRQLEKAGLASRADALRSATSTATELANANQARLEAQSLASTLGTELADRGIRQVRLERDIAALEGQIAMSRLIIEALEFEIQRRTIRAPTDGSVENIQPAPKGAFVSAGQPLASVVPAGSFRLVASYAAADAIGRVRPGAPAIVRLDAFPWGQYGTHSAKVTQIASEAQGANVRVELEIPAPNERLPLAHGLTGRVEIELERVTPWTMLVRTLGYYVSTPLRPDARTPPAVTESLPVATP